MQNTMSAQIELGLLLELLLDDCAGRASRALATLLLLGLHLGDTLLGAHLQEADGLATDALVLLLACANGLEGLWRVLVDSKESEEIARALTGTGMVWRSLTVAARSSGEVGGKTDFNSSSWVMDLEKVRGRVVEEPKTGNWRGLAGICG